MVWLFSFFVSKHKSLHSTSSWIKDLIVSSWAQIIKKPGLFVGNWLWGLGSTYILKIFSPLFLYTQQLIMLFFLDNRTWMPLKSFKTQKVCLHKCLSVMHSSVNYKRNLWKHNQVKATQVKKIRLSCCKNSIQSQSWEMYSQFLNVCPSDYTPCILGLGASQVVLVI